jgi:hypothetical protein
MMNEQEARARLKERLEFGNVRQIESQKFLVDLDECLRSVATCPYISIHRTKWLDGMQPDYCCDCVWAFSENVIQAAMQRLYGRGRR